MNLPTVLVLGAAGRFGASAVRAFAAAGWQVLAQQRKAPAAPLPALARWIDTPLDDTGALVRQAAGASVVVYAVNPLYTRWDAELLPLLDHGIAVAQRLGARLMLPGNVYNYGEQMPALLHEATPQRPTTPKGLQRVQMETALREAGRRGLASQVVRAGDFFGAGTGSWLDQAVAKDIARGKLVYPGPLNVPHAWAYLPDLARAFVALAARPAAPGLQCLHFEGYTVDGHGFMAALESAADTLGLRPTRGWRHAGMPWGLVRAVGLVNPLWRELARMSYLWRVPHGLDGAALARAAGPLAATPLVAALRTALAELPALAAPAAASNTLAAKAQA